MGKIGRFSPRTQGLLIRKLNEYGRVEGQRAGIHFRLMLERQRRVDELEIAWRASIKGAGRLTVKTGRASTVVEALQEIEEAFRQ